MKKLLHKFSLMAGKGVLIGGLTLFGVICLFGLVFFIGLWLGQESDDIALFHGNKYTISKSSTSYDLYDKDAGKVLSNVTGYLAGKDKSYIANVNELVIIDEKRGTYERKALSEVIPDEQEIIKKMKKIKSSPA